MIKNPATEPGYRQSYCLYFNLAIGISRKAAKSIGLSQPSLRLGVFARKFKDLDTSMQWGYR
jgi:hypothetical protein